MNPMVRWLRFNLVGALGMVVQLAALAVFSRLMPGHYLVASGAAVELTLLHNFTWHLHYTWRDRRDRSSTWAQLVRFQLSNGLVSLAGNLLLMRLLVDHVHLPLLTANAAAILCCSSLNFALSNIWAFHAKRPGPCEAPPAQRQGALAVASSLLPAPKRILSRHDC